MASANLRQRIRLLRRSGTTPDDDFIPQRPLYKLITRDVISLILREAGVSAFQIHELTNTVSKGGQKVFAILVTLKGEEARITNFIENDQFAQSHLDSRLPFPIEYLKKIIPDIADDFFEAQWQFIAPVFSQGVLHRELHDRTKLPFVQNTEIDQGGFGAVYEIQLDPDHQTLVFGRNEDALRVVRKEFKSSASDEQDYKRELQNLVILSELKHPNIVELLTSYTYRRKHNLVFRLAPYGNLATLLQNERPGTLESDDDWFFVLAQLASALSTIHNFTSKTLNLDYIGCHHDLKPKNILFDGKALIIADFGLSRFTEASESSKEQFEIGQGHYLAPECEDYDDQFQKHVVSRPRDVWSFGCILAEVVTYMLRGPSAIVEFKKERAIKIGRLKTYTFHGGRYKANPSVDPWLSTLELVGQQSHRMSIQLIKSMLALEPAERPKAQDIAIKLAHIAVVSYISSTKALFTRLLEATDTIEADMERRRFAIWIDVFESYVAPANTWDASEDAVQRYNAILQCLTECKKELEFILERCVAALSPLYSKLRLLIDQLQNTLSPELIQIARSQLELDMVESEDLRILQDTHSRCSHMSTAERICMLLTVKRMTILAFQKEGRERPDLYIENHGSIVLMNTAAQEVGEHSLRIFKENVDQTKRPVIVEWVRYSSHWEQPVSDEMMTRIEAIATLLNCPIKPIDHVLHCLGYFHEPSQYAFGVVYEFPHSIPPNLPRTPRTLVDIIQLTMDTRSRPSLEDRFLLAHQLANSVIDCHKVGWVHKSICSYNIVFFHPNGSKPGSWIESPYIVGFNRSRKDEPKAFTEGPKTGSRYKQYQHPLYATGQRYIPEFDFYSLAIVFLEIGLWKPLHIMTAGWKYASLEDFRRDLLAKRVSMLAHAMGSGYRDAVERCLNYNPSVSPPDEQISLKEPSKPRLDLGHEVLAGLGRCPCGVTGVSHNFVPGGIRNI